MARKNPHPIKLSFAMAELTEIRQTAQLSGEPLTRCRLKLPARRNVWERGWHEAHQVLEEERACRSLKPEDRMRIRDANKGLRDQFGLLRKT